MHTVVISIIFCATTVSYLLVNAQSSNSPYKHLIESNLDFSSDLYNELAKRKGYQDNIVFSPFGVYTVLLMTELGSRGQTSLELCRVLHLCQVNISYIHDAYGRIVTDLRSDVSIRQSLSMANRLYVQKGFEISKFYDYALRYYYNTTIRQVDFQNNSAQVREVINNWVHGQTSGRILHFLSRAPSQTTKMMTVNALYFDSDWLWKFDPAMTEPKGRFYVTPHYHTVVPMMVAKLNLAIGHCSFLDASILELPFKSNRISMFLILPDQLEGLSTVQKQLNSTTMKQLISTMKKHEVNVRIPRFYVESQPSITELLLNLGVHNLFSSTADLGRITSKNIYIGDMIHKAVINLDERGSMAVSVTATVVERIGTFNEKYFEADHPFLFFIMDKQTGLVLFMGRIASP